MRAPQNSVVAFPAVRRPAAAGLAVAGSGGQVLPLAMAFDRRRPGGAARMSAAPVTTAKSCTCGHEKQAHQHYRRGTDCAFCGCAKFSRSVLRRLLSGR